MDKVERSDSGGLDEELEMLVALHRSCELVFRGDGGARTVVRDRIGAVYSREGRKWLRTAGGLEIGLDQLDHVNGIRISKDC